MAADIKKNKTNIIIKIREANISNQQKKTIINKLKNVGVKDFKKTMDFLNPTLKKLGVKLVIPVLALGLGYGAVNLQELQAKEVENGLYGGVGIEYNLTKNGDNKLQVYGVGGLETKTFTEKVINQTVSTENPGALETHGKKTTKEGIEYVLDSTGKVGIGIKSDLTFGSVKFFGELEYLNDKDLGVKIDYTKGEGTTLFVGHENVKIGYNFKDLVLQGGVNASSTKTPENTTKTTTQSYRVCPDGTGYNTSGGGCIRL